VSLSSGLGVELDRERSVVEIVSASLGLYRRYPLLFLILAGAVMVPYGLVVLAVTGHPPLSRARDGFATSTLLFVLSFSLITPLISALHVHAVVSIGVGRRPTLAGVALKGLGVLPVVSAAEIVATFGTIAGYVALIVPGVLLTLRWSVVAQAAAIEHDGWSAALRRSGQLTAGHYRHIIGLLLITVALSFAVGFGAAAIQPAGDPGIATVTLDIALDTLVASFVALTTAILYFDLLARTSGRPTPSRPEYQHPRDPD
jgi:hypothetical protein